MTPHGQVVVAVTMLAVVLALASAELPLPDGLISIVSEDGRRLLLDCLVEGQMAFVQLIRHWDSQRVNTSCGLASVAAVLNALGLGTAPSDSVFAGEVRYFTEQNLLALPKVVDVVDPRDIAQNGLSLTNLTVLTRAASDPYVDAHLRDGRNLTLQEFRAEIADSVRQAKTFIVVNYDRQVLGQIGAGHHSPIGAYHSHTDQVLILDVAKQRYPPVWVPAPSLYEAVLDRRGYIIVRNRHAP